MNPRFDNQETNPLTETTFFLLLSLTSGPRHGYAILKDVQELSFGRVVLSTGTLYGAIKRLVEMGWIEPVDNLQAEVSGRPRKEYRLTSLGRRLYDAEFARLKGLVTAAQLRMSGNQA